MLRQIAFFLAACAACAAVVLLSGRALPPGAHVRPRSAAAPEASRPRGTVVPLDTSTPAPSDYDWRLPPGFPRPRVPADNPMSAAKVALGRHLFFDTRLSVNGRSSCATCHEPARAFTDGRAQALGTTGQSHPRGSMSLANVAYAPALTWGNPTVRRLEVQALVPLFGEDPVELGMGGREKLLLERLRSEPRYPKLFAAAYPGERDPFTMGNVTRAIASFERTLLSGGSPYDRYRFGADPLALSEQARRGEALFFGERTECFHCHGGFNLTESSDHEGKGFPELEFHNTGLYNLDPDGSYPAPNTGVHSVTGLAEDMGRFKAPTLRNVELTAPYMHDGSVATLEEVLDHYAAGGRTIASGPLRGVGFDNPNKSGFVKGFTLTPEERADLLAFLRSLTDRAFVEDPDHQDPWRPPASTPARP